MKSLGFVVWLVKIKEAFDKSAITFKHSVKTLEISVQQQAKFRDIELQTQYVENKTLGEKR